MFIYKKKNYMYVLIFKRFELFKVIDSENYIN